MNQASILIVDDTPANLSLLTQMLSKEGYRVRIAPNGKFALNSVNLQLPDLILLDIKMPEMNGYQVCESLKQNQKTADIPVIFLSALDDVIDKVKAFEVGGVDYITKPFENVEVLTRIKHQLKLRSLQLQLQNQNQKLEIEIEKRKEMEQILYQSRSFLSSILNSSLDGIAAMEAVRNSIGKMVDFRCILVNPVIAKNLGITPEDIKGKPQLKRILHKLNKLQLLPSFINVVETGKPLQDEFCYQLNNSQLYYDLVAVKLADGFAIIIRDISERKKSELKLAKVNHNLLNAQEKLRITNQDLEAFNYRVSHDLKNQISFITASCQILQYKYSNKFDDRVKEMLDSIEQSGKNMNTIIEGLSLLSKLKRQEIKKEDVSLSEIVQDIVLQLKYQNKERQAEFIIAPDLQVQGDYKLLTIALENLLKNAWKYTSKNEATLIEFGCFENINSRQENSLIFPQCPLELSSPNQPSQDSNLVYFIRDNGVGFDMEKAKDLFTLFKRLHCCEEFEGTGIGLSTVQEIILRHGGLIWCSAKVNEGATFYFTL
jgi:CheY-like chemotaxis protein/signal transduction histidine kinase